MTQYFCGTVEGEAPDDLSEQEVHEILNESMPPWAEAYLTRFDETEDVDEQ